MLKKLNLSIIFLFILSDLSSFSLSDLITSAFQNNSEVISAQSNYESAILSSKNLNGAFSPEISFSSSTNISKDYDWDSSPDYFSTYATYSQPLPGGTTFSATGTYSFTSATTFSAATATPDEGNLAVQRYIFQNPNISFTLSQSLLPFWAQGTIKDPTIFGAKQEAEYYRLQLLATKKSVLQNLLQNYAYVHIYKKQIQLYQNSISLTEKQIAALRELKTSGSTNQAKITELESTKWSYQEDLMSVQANFYSYLQNLKNICACEITEKGLFDDDFTDFSLSEEFFSVISDISTITKTSDATAPVMLAENSISTDPMEKIYLLKLQMLKNKRVLEKQKNAPTLTLSFQPAWSFEKTRPDDWQSAWKNAWEAGENPTWTASLGLNLSPLLSSAVKKSKKQYEISYAQAEKSYENYLQQRDFVRSQYKTLLENYSAQLENVSGLLKNGKTELSDFEKIYQTGGTSELDYEAAKIRVENCQISCKIVEIYKCLYEILVNII